MADVNLWAFQMPKSEPSTALSPLKLPCVQRVSEVNSCAFPQSKVGTVHCKVQVGIAQERALQLHYPVLHIRDRDQTVPRQIKLRIVRPCGGRGTQGVNVVSVQIAVSVKVSRIRLQYRDRELPCRTGTILRRRTDHDVIARRSRCQRTRDGHHARRRMNGESTSRVIRQRIGDGIVRGVGVDANAVRPTGVPTLAPLDGPRPRRVHVRDRAHVEFVHVMHLNRERRFRERSVG